LLKNIQVRNLYLLNPGQNGYLWIDLDEQYQNENKLNPIGGTPEELSTKDLKYEIIKVGVSHERLGVAQSF
jgi:hypothetical protein